MKEELEKLIADIPSHRAHPAATLEITLPTSSSIKVAEVLNLINDQAILKGWTADEITVIRTSGYVICDDCKRVLHLHVVTPDHLICMSCDGKHIHKSEAHVRIVED